jgi:chromosome segregation ATPase
MSHSWIDRRVRTAMQSETDALRAEIAALADTIRADGARIDEARAQAAELRGMIETLSAELQVRVEQADAGLNGLREAIDRDDRTEKLRLRLDGFAAQHRWDMDQLRQSLAAVAERLPIIG